MTRLILTAEALITAARGARTGITVLKTEIARVVFVQQISCDVLTALIGSRMVMKATSTAVALVRKNALLEVHADSIKIAVEDFFAGLREKLTQLQLIIANVTI